jgi:hypothetical protein
LLAVHVWCEQAAIMNPSPAGLCQVKKLGNLIQKSNPGGVKNHPKSGWVKSLNSKMNGKSWGQTADYRSVPMQL